MRSTVIDIFKKFHGRGDKTRGYTLVETAIVISVLGLIMASFISAYSLYTKTKAQQTTENNLSALSSSIGNFLVQKGRYPCPAQLNLKRGDARYGLESECDPAVTAPLPPKVPYPSTTTAGTCSLDAQGNAELCYENGVAAVDMSVDPNNVCPTGCGIPKIRRGAIPFRTLGIPEEMAYDGWGNRFQYAVTENLAVATSFVPTGGGITMLDTDNAAAIPGKLLTPADNRAHYIVFSSGPDRAGAITREGKRVLPCGTTGYDDENCNTSATNSTAIYSSAVYAPKPGALHFDDYVQFHSSVETPMWRVTDDAGYHIRDLIKAESTGQIGIGLKTPSANVKLEVADEIRAEEGNLMADKICDLNGGGQCMSTSDFASGATPFQCDPGTYAVAFGDVGGGKYIKCVPASQTLCPKGEVMTGFEFPAAAPHGRPICSSLAACPALSVTLCSGTPAQTTMVLAATAQSALPPANPFQTPVVGSDYRATYTCSTDASGTMWRKTGETGQCVCNGVDEYSDQTCASFYGTGNWTGVVTRHHTVTCPGGADTNVISSNTCTCQPTFETRLQSCASGLSGNITQRRDWICDTATTGHWTGWTNQSNTCTCTPSTTTGTQACQSWETGIINRHRDITCPTPTSSPVTGPWVIDSNTCTCFAKTEDIFPACPAGTTGTIVKRRTRDCATNSWGPYVEISNSCVCSGGTQAGSDPCPGPYDQGAINKQRTLNCATMSWGPWTVTSNTCTCVTPPPQTRADPCPAPLLGNIIMSRNYDCSTGAWLNWTEAQNNCGVVAYFWTAKSAANGPFGAPLAVQQGASCSTPGNTSSCSAAAGGGQYWHYSTCQCE